MGQGAAQQRGEEIGSPDGKLTRDIIRPEMDAEELAKLFAEFSGERVLVDDKVKGTKARLFIKASPEEPLGYGEVMDWIRKSAVLENLVFVEAPGEPRSWVLRMLGEGYRRGYVPVPVMFHAGMPLPEEDRPIIYIMDVHHVSSAVAVKNMLERGGGELKDFGSISAVPGAAAVILAGKTSWIRDMIEYQKMFDRPR